jgi:hypothetical protein
MFRREPLRFLKSVARAAAMGIAAMRTGAAGGSSFKRGRPCGGAFPATSRDALDN